MLWRERGLSNKALHNARTKWASRVGSLGERRNVYILISLVGITEGKGSAERGVLLKYFAPLF
jgi:type IV secretory pathway TrbF-like protein